MKHEKSILESSYRMVQKDVFCGLAPLGFKFRRSIALLEGNNANGILEFQRSSKSSMRDLLFTVNVGVVFESLVDPRSLRSARASPSTMNAQIRERIGNLLPEKQDRWWQITESTDLNSLCTEVSTLVLQYGVPFIRKYIRLEDALSLWKRGESPGLTDGEREQYLARLQTLTFEPAK